MVFFGRTTEAHLTLHGFFPLSSPNQRKDLIIVSIFAATLAGIGNMER
jgi:hypothetical protein